MYKGKMDIIKDGESGVRLVSAEVIEERIKHKASLHQDGQYYIRSADALKIIYDAPAVEPKQGWIPCEERMPKREDKSIMRQYCLTTNAYGSVGITAYEFEGGTWGVVGWHSDIRIIAWMPLPESYHSGEVTETVEDACDDCLGEKCAYHDDCMKEFGQRCRDCEYTDKDPSIACDHCCLAHSKYKKRVNVCPTCGRSDYIRSFKDDFHIKNSEYRFKCINCNTYIK